MNLANIIVICILVVILVFVFYGFIKRFTGRQTCCSTEKVRSKTKKLDRIEGNKTFRVEGMHCNNCRASIEKEINKLDGLSAKVNLEKKTLTVSYSPGTKVDTDEIISLLGDLGFTACEV